MSETDGKGLDYSSTLFIAFSFYWDHAEPRPKVFTYTHYSWIQCCASLKCVFWDCFELLKNSHVHKPWAGVSRRANRHLSVKRASAAETLSDGSWKSYHFVLFEQSRCELKPWAPLQADVQVKRTSRESACELVKTWEESSQGWRWSKKDTTAQHKTSAGDRAGAWLADGVQH